MQLLSHWEANPWKGIMSERVRKCDMLRRACLRGWAWQHVLTFDLWQDRSVGEGAIVMKPTFIPVSTVFHSVTSDVSRSAYEPGYSREQSS